MEKTTPTEDVLIFTVNGDSFPAMTEIEVNRTKLLNPIDKEAIKKEIGKKKTRLVIIDGCLPSKTIASIAVMTLAIKKREKLPLTVCIVHQDEIRIPLTVWERDITKVKKYLMEA